ncbi:hypothetical protein GUITHDRAFT_120570 [Guillardia theta CCMP2712]|uniref:Uncharacterized protein n=2 Tax=Guillardia theta TaxID=55529 RepID=L1IBG3_GUITC|nr:hypothetical protein GUITHDRAFT_120570 [Guillardia theta CCMP2712]EKX33254.1 hypothetical protein GUITHDRAFT_120570 [Guillardia theta CCMP2712]|eukprot:XP_005820234.1 hypothetical protein GUITHDRAFT_120570 [Guillardia theta CCMP2712]
MTEAASTIFYENFDFGTNTFRIKQDTSTGHAAVLWDAAKVLVKYFEVSGIEWKDKRVLDLGSGCGLVGICLASAGAHVTMTELPGHTSLLQENVENNLKAHCPGSWQVQECVWGSPGETTDWGNVTDMGQGWDFIVGSDLIYSDASTPHLLKTLQHSMDDKTSFVLSFELRREKDLDFLRNISKCGLAFQKIPEKELHPVWQAEEIGIFKIWKKS